VGGPTRFNALHTGLRPEHGREWAVVYAIAERFNALHTGLRPEPFSMPLPTRWVARAFQCPAYRAKA